MIRFVIAIQVVLLSGCCWTAKRTCFPPCPPKTVVTVEKHCKLPPPIKLSKIKRTEDGCPKDHACYDMENAGKLAKRLSDMADFIKETRKRCSPAPTSRPATPQ